MLKILVIDDEERMRKLVHDFLARSGYEVYEASNGIEALDVYDRHPDIALLILDVMMPQLDGYGVTREIRKTSKVPIIMLTAKSEEQDELQGFELGISDYVRKPFSPRVLVARVEALLAREGHGRDSERLESSGIVIDKAAHQVTIDGNPVELSAKEFELMAYFLENSGRALSREQILNHVWNYDYYGDARTIDTHVKKLRSKMGEKGDLIKTIWGLGYKFSPEQPLSAGDQRQERGK